MAVIKTERETRAVRSGLQGGRVYDTIQKSTDKTGDLVSVGIDNVALHRASMPADPGRVVMVPAGSPGEAVNVTPSTARVVGGHGVGHGGSGTGPQGWDSEGTRAERARVRGNKKGVEALGLDSSVYAVAYCWDLAQQPLQRHQGQPLRSHDAAFPAGYGVDAYPQALRERLLAEPHPDPERANLGRGHPRGLSSLAARHVCSSVMIRSMAASSVSSSCRARSRRSSSVKG